MFSDTRTGLPVLLLHVATLVGALLLLLTQVAIGATVRARLGARGPETAAWRWPVDATLGAGLLALVLLAAGAIGALQPASVLASTLALALLCRRAWAAAARELGVRLVPSGTVTEPGIETSAALLLRALLAVLVLLCVAAALAPPTEWDSLMYHLRIPLQLLEQGRLATPVDSFHVALVGTSHFATLPLLAAGLRSGPAVMQVLALVLTVAATTQLAARAGVSRPGGWIAAAMVLGSPAFMLVAITARVDVTLVLALVVAHLALLTARDEQDGRLVLVAALLVAVAMGIKPQAGAYALALVPLGWMASRGARPALAAAVVAGIASAPWYLKNQWLVGAPLYPKGAPGWFEPWIAQLYGTPIRPATVDASILSALPEARGTFDLLDAFFEPGRLTIEGEGVFYALSPLLLTLPLLLLAVRRDRRAVGIGAVALVYGAFVIVPFGQINMRYLMPAVPALAVAVVAGLESANAMLGGRMSTGMRRALVGIALLIALLPLSGAVRQRFLGGDAVLLRHALGIASAQEVWRRHPDGTARELSPTIANVQRLVPAGSRILFLWEARGAAFERDVLVDVMLSNWSYVAQSPAAETCLAGTGITHLLVGAGSVEYYVNRGADPRAFLLDRFARFRERCLGPNTTVGPGVELFPLR